MRPPEPAPSICERSTPSSSALRSAAGVACALSFCSPASPGVLASPTTASSSSPASTPSPGSAVAGVHSSVALLRSNQTASEITMSVRRTLIPSPTPLPKDPPLPLVLVVLLYRLDMLWASPSLLPLLNSTPVCSRHLERVQYLDTASVVLGALAGMADTLAAPLLPRGSYFTEARIRGIPRTSP